MAYWLSYSGSIVRSRNGQMNTAISSGGEPGLRMFAALRFGVGYGMAFL